MASSSSTRDTASDVLSAKALRRLQRDLQELLENPVEYVVAEPINDDLMYWSVNMVAADGCWRGLPIHLHMTFPTNYPDYPPNVAVVSDRICHPNVFGSWICLDMIKPPEDYSRPYQGWSSTYTVSAVLRQLYGFLLVDEVIDQDYGGRHMRADKPSPKDATLWLEDVQSCDCGMHTMPTGVPLRVSSPLCTLGTFLNNATRGCTTRSRKRGAASRSATPSSHGSPPSTPHAPSNPTQHSSGDCSEPSTVLAATLAEAVSSAPEAVMVGGLPLTGLLELDDAVLRNVLERLGPVDLHRCAWVDCGRLAKIARDVLQRSEQICFHSKSPSSSCVLGYGVQRSWHGSSSDLRSLSTATDYISLEAYEGGVRKSAWNIPFDAFLPLYLNPSHGARSLPLLPKLLKDMTHRPSNNPAQAQYLVPQTNTTCPQPKDLLRVLAQIMNSLLVEIVNLSPQPAHSNQAAPPTTQVSRHMSDAALQAFCHLHHLLLAVALQPGSGVLEQARVDVLKFISDPDSRHKASCPDLGVLLVEYLLVPREAAPWSAFAPPLLRELLSRNVYWAVKAHGAQFADTACGVAAPDGGSTSDYQRLSQHFESACTGIRNVMLQAWFANALARPSTTSGLARELGAIKSAYDECSGLPPPAVFRAFNGHARSVLRCGSWIDFLKGMRLGLRAGQHPRALMVAMLRQAVAASQHSWSGG